MISELESIKIGPNALKGRSREIVLRRFLKPFIPNSMGICNGIVTSTNGESGEVDLIIYDKKGFSLFKPLLDYYPKNLRPIPVETVYAVIEVENKLDEDSTKKCVDKIKKIKELPKSAYYEQGGQIKNYVNLYGKTLEYFPTLGIVFTFDGNQDKIIEILRHDNLQLEYKIDLVCILKKGLITYYNRKDNLLVFPPEPDNELVFKPGTPEENLKLSYLMLTRIFSQAWTKPIRVVDYFR